MPIQTPSKRSVAIKTSRKNLQILRKAGKYVNFHALHFAMSLVIKASKLSQAVNAISQRVKISKHSTNNRHNADYTNHPHITRNDASIVVVKAGKQIIIPPPPSEFESGGFVDYIPSKEYASTSQTTTGTRRWNNQFNNSHAEQTPPSDPDAD